MTDSLPSAVERCPSCGAELGARFCPRCGEKRRNAHDLTLRAFAEHLLESLYHFDGKFLRTLRVLARPGLLTAEFVRGARTRQMRPLQLFLLVNLLYFFVQPWTGFMTFTTPYAVHEQTSYGRAAREIVERKEASSGRTHENFVEEFDHAATKRAKLLIVLMIPSIAAILAAIEAGKRRELGVHLVLAAEFMTFQLITLCMLMPVALSVVDSLAPGAFQRATSGQQRENVVSLVGALVVWLFFAIALGRVYRNTVRSRIALGFLAMIGYWCALFAYRALLFFVTLWTI